MPNLPRAALALLLLCYISESCLALAASRGYYPLPDSSSGSEEGMIRAGGDEETSSTSSELGYESAAPRPPPSLTFGQHEEANGPQRKANIGARPTQSKAGRGRNEVFIFDLPAAAKQRQLAAQQLAKSNGMEMSEDTGENDQALFEALDRKYENAKSSANQGWQLYPSKQFGKMHSYSTDPDLYRPVKRNLSCMRKCMAQGFIHPVQCHSLC